MLVLLYKSTILSENYYSKQLLLSDKFLADLVIFSKIKLKTFDNFSVFFQMVTKLPNVLEEQKKNVTVFQRICKIFIKCSDKM